MGRIFPRSGEALLCMSKLTELNNSLSASLTGHSLGGAIAREVGKMLHLRVVTFNAATPPSAPVTSGPSEVDYHTVFDIVSAWQSPNTVRIDKGCYPLPSIWHGHAAHSHLAHVKRVATLSFVD